MLDRVARLTFRTAQAPSPFFDSIFTIEQSGDAYSFSEEHRPRLSIESIARLPEEKYETFLEHAVHSRYISIPFLALHFNRTINGQVLLPDIPRLPRYERVSRALLVPTGWEIDEPSAFTAIARLTLLKASCRSDGLYRFVAWHQDHYKSARLTVEDRSA